MKKHLHTLLNLIIVLSLSFIYTSAQTPLKVCPNPSAPCKSKHREFYPYDLSFTLPAKIKANVDYKSAPFFAIILKESIKVSESEECDGGEFHKRVEADRKKIQAGFPDKKVFASYQCPDMGALSYMVNGQPLNDNFIALYAGETQGEADLTMLLIKSKYPKAALKKMQVIFNRIEQ
jgi:hypothetical protein